MTTAMLLTTPNHKMGHDFMNSFTPSRMDESLLHKMIFSTPNNFTVSTPITPSSTSQSSVMSKYVNLGTIGEGSYGLVLKCKDRQNGRVVAIKKFIESEEDKSVRKIAMREIHLLKQLRHENLVNLLEVFRRKRRLYLVFEFVEKSLLDHLDTSPSGLERGQCRRILYQVVRALEFCHIHNIIHRDVKPENILISKHGVVKLCDFGFARTLAKPGEIYTEYVSTRWYRAPELLVGDIRYGRAVDIWALGCLSAEMMTGQPLFPGDSDIDQLFSIVKCFGCLCRRHEERLYSSPMFRFEISQIEVTEPLKCRLRGCTSREFQFVASCLELDPQDRPTCSSLMRHPLFTCDGFNSWFPEELQQMLRKDADEHKLQPERPKPRRQLPDLNKCLQLSSTPIKGFGQVTPLSHHPHHTPDPGQHHDHKHPAHLPGKTHRNLEEAFGSCTVAAADEGLHGTGRDDGSAPQDQSVNSSLNFDLQPLDLSSSFNNNNNISSTTCLDLDLSFSHLSIVEGIEVEGEELPHKSVNIDEEDDYASEANEGDYASEDDDYAENSVRVVRGKSPRSNESLNYEGGDGTNGRQHPVSLLSCDSQKKLDNNTATNNNIKNNKNNQSKKKKQNNKVHQSLPMSSSSSSSASSSSAMTSLPSPSSSATTSGVSSPSSSSSSSSASSCSMRKFSKNSTNSINHFNNNNKNNRNNNINNRNNSINNRNNINHTNNSINHRNNSINNRNNNINHTNNSINHRNSNFIDNSSNSLNQSPRGSHADVTSKSQNQKSSNQYSTTNTKNNKQHTNSYKPDSIHHHYQHHQQQQGRTPCKPLQQKNVIHPFHQQPRQQQQQQQSHCKQVENESPKFGQKFYQQPKHQNSHQKQQQQQQNIQPKPSKKKDFGRQNPSTSKHVAKQPFVPIGANNGQSKTAYRNS